MGVWNDRALPGRDVGFKEFFKEIWNRYTRTSVGDVAAALTFYAVLGLFPFLLFLVALASLFVDASVADELVEHLSHVAPNDVTSILSGVLHELGRNKRVGLLTLGAVLAVWSASGAAAALMTSLNVAYGVKETRGFIKRRLIALEATLVAAGLVLLAGLVTILIPPVLQLLHIPWVDSVLWLRLPLGALLTMVAWNFLYWLLPNRTNKRLALVTPGSILGVCLWVLASIGFSIYVNNYASYNATYGALGGIIVLLFWMWISAQALVLGAEIDAVTLRLACDKASEQA